MSIIRNPLALCAAPLLLAALATPALAEPDFDPAGFLAAKCSSCHGTEVYTRAEPRVKDLTGLEAQVRRCDANLGTALFDEDILSLVQHLDSQYYRF